MVKEEKISTTRLLTGEELLAVAGGEVIGTGPGGEVKLEGRAPAISLWNGLKKLFGCG
jgi:hypothetical protein